MAQHACIVENFWPPLKEFWPPLEQRSSCGTGLISQNS